MGIKSHGHMLTDAQSTRLQDSFDDRAPTLAPGMCLNAYHRGAACSACVNACPAAAITVSQGIPHLQTERCIRCGLCLATCPTEALCQDAPPERKLTETAAGLPDAQLTIVCALHPHPARPAAPVTTVLHHRRCLAALDLGDLLALCGAGKRTVWLDDSSCPACPLQAADALRTRVAVANELLAAYGQPACLNLASVKTPPPNDQSCTVLDGNRPKLSRRRLFGTLRRVQNEHESAPWPARRRLLATLPKTAETAAVILPSSAPFAQVSVDPARCSACGLCAYFCPTAALTWTVTEPSGEDDATTFGLGFHAALCIVCPICKLACPEEAIRLVQGVTAAALAPASPPISLVAGRLAACPDCGALTAATSNDSRCYVCRHSVGTVAPLRDDAGLMADLIRRSASPAAE